MRQITPNFPIKDLIALAESANEMLDEARSRMLEPHPRKRAPMISSAKLAELCQINVSQIPHLAKRDDLPKGTVESRGRRRNFTLAEARQWIAKLSKHPRRPEGCKAATISVVNFKGGSTKTTVAFNLAQGLTLLGYKVLLIDLDPQGSATTLTGMLPAAEVLEEHTVAPITYPAGSDFAPPTDLRPVVQDTYWDGLSIIPAAPTLFNAEIMLPIRSRDRHVAWWNFLNAALDKVRDDFDVIVLDTAPALSYLAVNGVMAADGLLMPVPPQNLDFASSVAFWNLLAETLKGIEEHKGITKDFAFMRVLLSRVTNSVATSIVKDWIIKTYGPYMLTTEIPASQAQEVGTVQFNSVYDVERYEGSAKTYAKIREAFDKLVEDIDQSILSSVWGVTQ